MKAVMNQSGVLSVEGENALEDYALKKWYEDWQEHKSMLQILEPDINRPDVVIPNFVKADPY